MQELTVKNSKRARVGDTVKIGLVQRVQYTGYLLAYVIPSAALVFGMVGGHFLGTYAGFPPLDIIAGFTSLIVVSFFSLRRLKHLDSSSSIEIVNVLSDPWNPGSRSAAEETIPDHFILLVVLILRSCLHAHLADLVFPVDIGAAAAIF